MAVDIIARMLAEGRVPITAYDMAVAGGYVGTKEEFEADMGNSGTNATTAANAAAEALAAAANLAPEYDATKIYSVGSYVLHEGGLYICSTAITTAEAWNAAHWTSITLAPEVEKNTSALDIMQYEQTVDVSVLPKSRRFIIRATGIWSSADPATPAGAVVFGIDGAIKITVKANASYNAYIAFLKSPSNTQGTTADFCDEYPGVQTVSAGTTMTFNAKSSWQYMYVYVMDTSGNDHIPDSTTLQYSDMNRIAETYITRGPDGYERIEYAESDRTQTCSLGVSANQDTRFICRFKVMEDIETLASAVSIFGGRYLASDQAFAFGVSAEGRFRVNWNTAWYDVGAADNDIHTIEINKNQFYLDGILKNSGPDGVTFESYRNIQLFGIRGYSSYYYGASRIYRVLMYDEDGELVRDCVPAVKTENGRAYIYDFITGSAYGAYNPDPDLTVTFAAGPVTTVIGAYDRIGPLEDFADKAKDDLAAIQATVTEMEAYVAEPYVMTEADRVSDKVRNVQTPNTLTFIAISDLHYRADNDASGATIRAALKDMSDGVKAVAAQTHIDFYTSFGDIIWRLSADGDFDLGKKEIIESTKLVSACFSNNPQIRMTGNHDPNAEGLTGYFTAEQLNAFMGIYSKLLTPNPDYPYGGYGYADFEDHKIRFIVLNTSFYYKEGDGTSAGTEQPSQHSTQYSIYVRQAEWLCRTLDISDKEDAAQWQIVIMSHVALDQLHTTGGETSPYALLVRYTPIIDAYNNGTSVTPTGSSNTYDFSGKNAAPIAAYINGHAHAYRLRNVNNYVFDSGTQTYVLDKHMKTANLFMPNALPDRDGTSTDGVVYTKTAGTGESTAFEVITLDPVNKVIYAHHYGAGIDIIMHYDPTSEASYSSSMTAPLTWATTDAEIATVSDGTVTPVANGYAMVWAKSEADNCIECWNYQAVV